MASGLLERYPLLIEFSYLKMVAVMVLIALNKSRRLNSLPEVAEGPIAREMKSISYARKYFRKGNYFLFVLNFNLMNRFSLVCHPVFYHNDIFHRAIESVENKSLLVDYSRDGYFS